MATKAGKKAAAQAARKVAKRGAKKAGKLARKQRRAAGEMIKEEEKRLRQGAGRRKAAERVHEKLGKIGKDPKSWSKADRKFVEEVAKTGRSESLELSVQEAKSATKNVMKRQQDFGFSKPGKGKVMKLENVPRAQKSFKWGAGGGVLGGSRAKTRKNGRASSRSAYQGRGGRR
jgi:hypothetical protein